MTNKPQTDNTPILDWIPTFIAATRDRDACDLTVDRYRLNLTQYATWLQAEGRPLAPQELGGKRGAEHLSAYLGHLRDSGIASGTRRTFYQVVKTFFRWCAKESLDEDDEPTLPPYVKKAPTEYVDIPKDVQLDGVGEDYTEAEYERMLGAAGDPRTNNVWKRRNRALMILLYHTGLRRKEAAGLLISDYDTASGHLTIRNSVAKRTKRGKDARTVALHNGPKVEMDKYVRLLKASGLNNGPLLPSERKPNGMTRAIQPNGINQIVRSLALGLQEACKDRSTHGTIGGCAACIRWTDVHRWRHTWAIHSLMRGVAAYAVKSAGGWANDAMMERYIEKAKQRLSLKEFDRVNANGAH